MIKNFKLFENKVLKDPWSDFNLKNHNLQELKDSLEIEIFEGEEWVILHHFGSEKAYKPEVDYTKLLKEKILDKYGGEVSTDDVDVISNFVEENSYTDIDRLDIYKFLNYPKWSISSSIENGLARFLGYENFGDFIKNTEIEDRLDTGIDPKFYGTGVLTRDDERQLPFGVMMFYTDLKDAEPQTRINNYFKIRFPLKKLYPLYKDPLNLDYGGSTSIKNVMINAREKGFSGTIVNWKTVHDEQVYRVDIWEYIPISYIEDGEIKNTKYLVEYRAK